MTENPVQRVKPPKEWAAVLKQTGIRDLRFHDLRHTAASYLAMSGATLAEIADVLGHRTLQMVKRYAHLSQQHTSSVVLRMTTKYLNRKVTRDCEPEKLVQPATARTD
jgi:integrase